MDFYTIRTKEEKDGSQSVYPEFFVGHSKDLLVRSGLFQAVWDAEVGLWSTNEFDVARIIDKALYKFADDNLSGHLVNVKTMKNHDNKSWSKWKKFLRELPDTPHELDQKLVFANTEVKKEDYATFRLPYSLEEGNAQAWDEIVGTLYTDEERRKIEWAIGAVVAGDAEHIQKFLVFFGKAGTGKSTILNVIEALFAGYATLFNAKELTSANNSFALAPFASNPLVAIQHDGDLSKIEDNTQLNMITAHELISINRKYMQPYKIRPKAFIFMGTNDPVKIKNAKAGMMRRLIDVLPSGKLLDFDRYQILMDQVQFELGAIAYQCWKLYSRMGADGYASYVPTGMQWRTDPFYNYIEAHHDVFKAQNGVTLKQSWDMYKAYCEDSNINPMSKHKFKDALADYFDTYNTDTAVDGERMKNYFSGYRDILKTTEEVEVGPYSIELDAYDPIYFESPFNTMYAEQPAQLAKNDIPRRKWENNDDTLSDLDPAKLHFVKVPEQHIVIDFDLVDEDGEKDVDLNLEAARHWPPTYTELSKSGKGVHLHYLYSGDVRELESVFDVGIEVKTLLGDSSLRRKLTKHNGEPVASISSGLPKKEARVIDQKSISTEKGLRELIERNLRKEIHGATKPSMDFIHKILADAYEEGVSYDVRDMRPRILAFAAKSTNQAAICLKMMKDMAFVGKDNMPPLREDEDAPIIFFDIEVYPNLLVICWKRQGIDEVVKMINPSPSDVELLLGQKLVGFNNRRYDNHILYARYLGWELEDLYGLSQKIINNNKNAPFGEAYNISYTDIYDFSAEKKGLKKFMIELGIKHMEMDIPWDQPVHDDLVPKVVEYCANDVRATEEVFEARKADFIARQILADISGLTVNHTTANHTAKILFGDDKRPQDKFVYTDLSTLFPGYTFDGKESTYRGETTSEGGYVYAEPGVYDEVALLDVASMHPTSIVELDLFGPYTQNYRELLEARMAIKHQDFGLARGLLGGKLSKFLADVEDDAGVAGDLAYALKIVANTVYGLTAAHFDNPFRDNRNKDNIVAKRGALFMIELKHALQEKGVQIAHIKTDSVKIPHATPEIIEFVHEFGKKYGYDFEHEETYEKFALVNDAVYVAWNGEYWTAVGAQFQQPYVFKTLFSGEPLDFQDYCETRNVNKGVIYLDTSGTGEIEEMVHIGRIGEFVPVSGELVDAPVGGDLWRVDGDKKFAVTGTKGHKWIPREIAEMRNLEGELEVDMSFYETMAEKAKKAIEEYQPFDEFVDVKENTNGS